MIIECKNCKKKFIVKDSIIPNAGRVVQCGNCSTQWHQMPISSQNTNIDVNIDKKLPAGKFTASDGKTYKFLGNQWAEIHSSGKTGRLAKKTISKELNNLAKRKKIKRNGKKVIKESDQLPDLYKEKVEGMGVFSYLIVLIMFIFAIILFLDTFKNLIIPFWPKLDNYLIYIFETLNNVYFIIKDLFNNYK